MRFPFAKWDCDRLTEDANFRKNNHVLDEDDFDLDGYVNKQDFRILGHRKSARIH